MELEFMRHGALRIGGLAARGKSVFGRKRGTAIRFSFVEPPCFQRRWTAKIVGSSENPLSSGPCIAFWPMKSQATTAAKRRQEYSLGWSRRRNPRYGIERRWSPGDVAIWHTGRGVSGVLKRWGSAPDPQVYRFAAGMSHRFAAGRRDNSQWLRRVEL